MASVLITGGGGYIGHACALAFATHGWDVHVLDHKTVEQSSKLEALVALGCKHSVADIRDGEAVGEAMQGCDALIHLAAITSVPASVKDPETTMSVNVDGTATVLAAAAKYKVQRVIIASSAAVYGSNPSMPLDEHQTLESLSPYAESKRLNELELERYRAQGMNGIALRFFNVYGGHQLDFATNRSVIPSFIRTMAAGEGPHMHGDGTQSRDFIHVDDLANAIVQLAHKASPFASGVANVCCQKEHTLLDVVEGINRQLVKQNVLSAPLQATHREGREGDIHRSFGSNQRLKSIIDWEPSISLEEGLAQMIIRYLEEFEP
ncbi:MAG: NAD-dependent epimerase/dehydratase family protein [Poseidonia sp.]